MTPDEFVTNVIDEGLDFLAALGGPPLGNDVVRFMLAIALQESGPGLNARYQNSPSSTPLAARGFWQFEQGGGVTGVLNHAASRATAMKVCDRLTVVAQPAAVWRAIEGNDLLATSFARLLIWTDPARIPTAEQEAWDYYLRTWRPGKPRRDDWSKNWKTASGF